MDFLKKAAEFIKSCNPKETAVIYHKHCGDGTASAVIMARTINPAQLIPFAYTDKLSDLKLNHNIKNLIFVDISIDSRLDDVKTLLKKYRIMIVDHHVLVNNLNKFGVLHVHPKLWNFDEPSKYVGAKLAYDICMKVKNILDLDWLAAAGVIHDVAGQRWKEFIDKVCNTYKLKYKDKYGFDSDLGKIGSFLGFKEAAQIAITSKTPDEILYNEKLNKMYNHMQKEVNYFVDNWEGLAEIHNDLVWYKLSSKQDIASSVATTLGMKYQDKLFICFREKGGMITFSLRCHDKHVDCSDLARKSSEGIGIGGGHKPAAGCQIEKDKIEEFKRRVLEYLHNLS